MLGNSLESPIQSPSRYLVGSPNINKRKIISTMLNESLTNDRSPVSQDFDVVYESQRSEGAELAYLERNSFNFLE